LLEQILDLIHRHAWVALAALVIGLFALALKSPAIGSPLARIPREQRPRLILLAGVASGVLQAVVAGTPWIDALVGGLVSAGVAVLGHGVAGGLSPLAAPTVQVLPSAGPVVETEIVPVVPPLTPSIPEVLLQDLDFDQDGK
jgi:hypothetical protein